jgi:hypothetical protein
MKMIQKTAMPMSLCANNARTGALWQSVWLENEMSSTSKWFINSTKTRSKYGTTENTCRSRKTLLSYPYSKKNGRNI